VLIRSLAQQIVAVILSIIQIAATLSLPLVEHYIEIELPFAMPAEALAMYKTRTALAYATEKELRAAVTTSALTTSLLAESSSSTSPSRAANVDIEEEVERLQDLLSFCVLDSDREEAFDELTESAREKFHASWAAISLVDLGRQWMKAYSESPDAPLKDVEAGTECAREHSFCARAIQQDSILVVPDASKDERFCENPAVTGDQHLRFYAGAPLVSPNGHKIGALAVMANEPRPEGLNAAEEQILTAQASAVVDLLVQRRDSLQTSTVSSRKRSSSKVGERQLLRSNSDILPANQRISPSSSSGSLSSLDVGSNNIVKDESSVSVVGRRVENSGKRSRASSPSPPSERNHFDEDVIPSPKQIQVILPSPKTEGVDPDEYLVQLVGALHPGVNLKTKSSKKLDDFFPVITEEQMARYGTQVVNMARQNDVAGLRSFFQEHGRDALDCFNRFGEGLLNMSCRRGFREMTKFLLSPEVDLDVRVRDDYGRTPLHDACWNPEPQLEICTWIVQKDPSLFLVADCRGFTPFQYARKSDWNVWRQFLWDNRESLRPLASPEIASKFS